MTTAKQVLAGIRRHWSRDPVIREVVLRDPVEAAIYARWYADKYPWGLAHAEKRGTPLADSVPEGWTSRVSKAERRIDALLLQKTQRSAIEIKVSLADFRRETDEKRRAWRDHTHKFYYAAPTGLLTSEMMPEGCGLLEFDEQAFTTDSWRSGITVARKAKVNKAPLDLPEHLVRAMFYRVSNYEHAAEGAT